MIQPSKFHTSQPPTNPCAFSSSEIHLRTAGMSLSMENRSKMLNQTWIKGASPTLCAREALIWNKKSQGSEQRCTDRTWCGHTGRDLRRVWRLWTKECWASPAVLIRSVCTLLSSRAQWHWSRVHKLLLTGTVEFWSGQDQDGHRPQAPWGEAGWAL